MSRNAWILGFMVLGLAAGSGCSSKPSADTAKKAAAAPDKIQGKAQVLVENGGAMDAALNAGGSSVYIWEGVRRYRLFLSSPYEFTHGDEYSVEGVIAQRVIDEIGDPDNGKGGYPLQSSCEHVVRMVWGNLPMDTIDLDAQVLRTRVNRYPARPVFLVTRIHALKPGEGGAEPKKDAAKDAKEISVPADKQKAALIEGSVVQPAPLWEPAGKTVKCEIVIGPDGKVVELGSGTQLCEAVPWAQFRYQPPAQAGHPVKIRTEVEVKFEPKKAS